MPQQGPSFFEYAMSHYYAKGTHQPGHMNLRQQFQNDKPQSLVYLGGHAGSGARERLLANELPAWTRSSASCRPEHNRHAEYHGKP